MSNLLFHIITGTGRTVQFIATCYIPYFSDSLHILPINIDVDLYLLTALSALKGNLDT